MIYSFDMKKYLFALAAVALLFAVSCKKDSKPGNDDEPAIVVPEGAVDLGIVMTREDGTTYELYWAKSNLSDSGLCPNEWDYGDYYAWGETEPYYTSLDPLGWKDGKTGYNWYTYKWSGDNYMSMTKYCTSSGYGTEDNITELQRGEKTGETMDDAARAKLGGKWRMPTDAELEALRTQCTSEWTSRNGIDGRLVTGPNGNSIFLPAAGNLDQTSLGNKGAYGLYWSATLDKNSPYGALGLSFRSTGNMTPSSDYRKVGRSIRPVTE
jgi:hypothetical protein